MSISPTDSAIASPNTLDVALPPTQAELPCNDGEPMNAKEAIQKLGSLVEVYHASASTHNPKTMLDIG